MTIKHELFSDISTLGIFHGGFHTSRCACRIIRHTFTADLTMDWTEVLYRMMPFFSILLQARPRPNAVVTETLILLYENVVDGK